MQFLEHHDDTASQSFLDTISRLPLPPLPTALPITLAFSIFCNGINVVPGPKRKLFYSIYMYIKKYMILIGQTKSLVMMTQKSHRAFSWFVLERQA